MVISAALLRKHVFLLASDSLQGRLTGAAGQKLAATYCISSFRQSHLVPVFRLDSTRSLFRQTFPFTVSEVAHFGSVTPYETPLTYKHYELSPSPLTTEDSSRLLFGDNIGGLLIGTDLKREVVVLTAHYDHLGFSGASVYHGADDNASGTATILSVASVFDSLTRAGIRSRRSILFLLFSGEEAGLLGSRYFITHSPIPLDQLICDLNVDMVGRVDFDHRKHPDYCYLITNGQGRELQNITERANQQSVHLALNQGGYDTRNDPNRYFYRSDHFNFAKMGIPILFFTDGEHPEYHRVTDTADRISYDVLQKRATLLFQTAWQVANPTP